MRRLLPSIPLLFAASLGVTAARADDGPTLELAPEHGTGAPPPAPTAAPEAPARGGPSLDAAILRGLEAQRKAEAEAARSGTAIGGYGEIAVRGTRSGEDGERAWVADLARLVVFVAHAFGPEARAYTELEVEHAKACAGCGGAVELEQAYVELDLLGEALTARGGLVLVPMGVINTWHEPPIYHGVARPRFDAVVIPSTWRELSLGVTGQPVEGVRYQAYVTTGLDPTGFGAGGIGGGRQSGSFARTDGPAVVARLEVEPLLGAVLGLSGYASDAGANAELHDRRGNAVNLSMPVLGWSGDLRFRRHGFEWRFLYAEWSLPEAAALMGTHDEAGTRLHADPLSPVPTRIRGAYLEAAYDVLHPFGVSHQLLPFARIERNDTQVSVPDGYAPNPTHVVRDLTVGLSYRPIPQIVLKTDLVLRDRLLGVDESIVGLGGGFMY